MAAISTWDSQYRSHEKRTRCGWAVGYSFLATRGLRLCLWRCDACQPTSILKLVKSRITLFNWDGTIFLAILPVRFRPHVD